MSEATPPTPHEAAGAVKGAAKKGASFFKGRPKWQYIAGFTILVGVAYLVWRKQNAAPSDPSATTAGTDGTALSDNTGYVTDGPAVAGDLGGGYVFAPPTQGAYGGGSDPIPTVPDVTGTDNAQPSGIAAPSITYNISAPTVEQTVPSTPTAPVTGGGPPNRPTTGHQAQGPAAQLVAIPPGKVPGYKGTNTTDGKNQGRRYKVVYRDRTVKGKKVKWIYHDYESSPGKADYGHRDSDRTPVGPA